MALCSSRTGKSKKKSLFGKDDNAKAVQFTKMSPSEKRKALHLLKRNGRNEDITCNGVKQEEEEEEVSFLQYKKRVKQG